MSETTIQSPTKIDPFADTDGPGESQTKGGPKLEETTIQNLTTFDPFADADEPGETRKQGTGNTRLDANKIHIRIQQRNGRKTLTTVQGIPNKYDLKRILKEIKKRFACNGTIVADEQAGEVIQLQGDQRKNVYEFLTSSPDAKKDYGLGLQKSKIETHGF